MQNTEGRLRAPSGWVRAALKRPARRRSLPGIEALEGRVVLTTPGTSLAAVTAARSPSADLGDYVFVDGERKMLVRRTDELVVGLAPGAGGSVVGAIPASSALGGFTVDRSLTDTIQVLRRTGMPVGPQPLGFRAADGTAAVELAKALPGVAWTAPVFEFAETGTWAIATNEVIVALRPGVTAEQYFAGDRRFSGYEPLAGTNDQFIARAATGYGVATVELAARLSGDPRLQWAEPNFYQQRERFSTPDDPLFPSQWHLNNTGQFGGTPGADVNALAAWGITTGSSSITISVVDDGMDLSHPDLQPNLFRNVNEVAGNGLDDDGNGWVDDINGWDFTSGGANGDNNPGADVAGDAHATSVAGVAAGRGNNGVGISGIAPNVRILPVRIFSGANATTSANIAAAVNYAAGRNRNGVGQWTDVHIMNHSWGGGASAAITSAFTWATTQGRSGLGVVSFVASGNSGAGTVSYPASLASTNAGVVAVGASDNFNERSAYSQFGEQLDVVAPSDGGSFGIVTTDRQGTAGYNTAPGTAGNYTTTAASAFGGTSSATPLAAGIGALVLSRAADVGLSLTASQVRGLMRNTTDYIGTGVVYNASTGFNTQYGFGKVNAFTAVSGVGKAEVQLVDGRIEVPSSGGTVAIGPVAVGTTSDRVLRIRNQGTTPLNLGTLSLGGSSAFSIVQSPGLSTLDVGQSTSFTVRFAPAAFGSQSATVSFATNDSDEPVVSFALSGLGVVANVSGRAYEDFNVNGILDGSEQALAGRRVFLDVNGNGSFDAISATYSNTSAQPIPDNPTAGLFIPVAVAGAPTSITRMTVRVNATHTWVGDLALTLISPTGVVVPLITYRGDSGDNLVQTVFEDGAATSIASAAAPFTGSFRPESPLSAFNGLDANGTWTLRIRDGVPGDTGAFQNVSLTFHQEEPTRLTDASGNYEFLGLSAGSYGVGLVPTADWLPRMSAVPVSVAAPSSVVPGVNLGALRANSVYGRVFHDVDGDGQPGGSEPGLAGRTVFVDVNNNGVLDGPVNQSLGSGSVNIPIPDNNANGINHTINVAGLSGTILDVDVTLNVTHTWIGDLVVTLTGPNNQTITLVNRRGGSGDNFTGTILDDQAAASIVAGSAPFAGRFRPEQPLSNFNGISPEGGWRLNVSDRATSDLGTLLNWSLTFTVQRDTSAVTDADGYYRIDGYPGGAFAIRAIGPDGWAATSPASGAIPAVGSAQPVITGATFGFREADTTPPVVQSIERVGPATTNATQVSWTVSFSEAVQGLGLANFALSASGLTGFGLIGIEGSGSVYTITANVGSGAGSLALSLVDGGGVTDLAGNALAGLPVVGPAYQVDRVAPRLLEYWVTYGNGQRYNLLNGSRPVLPWRITGIELVFDEAATASPSALIANGGALPFATFQGSGTSRLAWTFATPLDAARVSTVLAAGAVSDTLGNAIGADIFQGFNVLEGDYNGDGVVSTTDLLLVRNAIGSADFFADIDGDGQVTMADYNLVRSRIGRRLPT